MIRVVPAPPKYNRNDTRAYADRPGRDVICPTCGAEVGARCTRPNGEATRNAHRPRLKLSALMKARQ